jgi:CheY-like chemotaxis protein
LEDGVTGRRILIVDDDAPTRDVLSLALREEGFEPLVAADGEDALDILEAEADGGRAPSLILLDVQMPRLDGPAFARAYRERFASPAPILLKTAGRPTPDELLAVGASAFVQKPFDLDALLGQLDSATPAGGPLRFLLVEDNPADARLVAEALRDVDGVALDVAEDGERGLAALRHAATSRPHRRVVLLDLGLPGADGLAVLEAIRSDAQLRRVPVVMLTGSQEEMAILRAYDGHANGYVVKDHDPEAFDTALRSLARFWLLARVPTLGAN